MAGKDVCHERFQDSDTYGFYAGLREPANRLASVVQSDLLVPGPDHGLSIGEAEKYLALLRPLGKSFAGKQQGLAQWGERLAPHLVQPACGFSPGLIELLEDGMVQRHHAGKAFGQLFRLGAGLLCYLSAQVPVYCACTGSA